jgi:hypothetical protein
MSAAKTVSLLTRRSCAADMAAPSVVSIGIAMVDLRSNALVTAA